MRHTEQNSLLNFALVCGTGIDTGRVKGNSQFRKGTKYFFSSPVLKLTCIGFEDVNTVISYHRILKFWDIMAKGSTFFDREILGGIVAKPGGDYIHYILYYIYKLFIVCAPFTFHPSSFSSFITVYL